MPVTRPTRPTRPSRTIGTRFAIAALAGVILAVGVSACGSGDDVRTDSASTSAAPTTPDGPVGSDPGAVDDPDDGATGFYVPGELPEGWTARLDHVSNPVPQPCPCEHTMWREASGATLLSFTSEAQEDLAVPSDSPIGSSNDQYLEIPGGYVTASEYGVSATWLDGSRTHMLATEATPETEPRFDAEEMARLARAWMDRGELVPPAGFEPVWSGTMAEAAWATELYWTIGDGERTMAVNLQPWPYDVAELLPPWWGDAVPVVLEGNGMEVVQQPGWDEPYLSGVWPGRAWIVVGESYGEYNYTGPYLSREEILRVAGGFRAVSAEEWAAYVAAQIGESAADACEPLLLGDRLADLRVLADDPRASLDVRDLQDTCDRASEAARRAVIDGEGANPGS
jgi:hypothetical protein